MPYAHVNFRDYRERGRGLLTEDLDVDLDPIFVPRRGEP